jgi:hypothetical protein
MVAVELSLSTKKGAPKASSDIWSVTGQEVQLFPRVSRVGAAGDGDNADDKTMISTKEYEFYLKIPLNDGTIMLVCTLEDVFNAVVEIDVGEKEYYQHLREIKDFTRNTAKNPLESLRAQIGEDIMVGEDDDDDSWEVITKLSKLCLYPAQIDLILKEICRKISDGKQAVKAVSKELPLMDQSVIKLKQMNSIKKKALEIMRKDPLLFTYAMRNVLTRLAFHLKLKNTVHKTLLGDYSEHLKNSASSLNDTFAFVGNNRLLSPNNYAGGVSYSADIDYKLIIDSTMFGTPQEEEMISDLINAQRGEKDEFDEGTNLVLQVQDFTTRSIADIEELLGTNNNSPEMNFFASIYGNNIHIAGSRRVCDVFMDLLHSDNLEVARRNWHKCLGNSDKGSIKWIARIKEVKGFVDEAVDIFLVHTYVNEEIAVGDEFKDYKERNSGRYPDGFLKSPKVFQAMLNVEKVRNSLVQHEYAKKLLKNALNAKNLNDMFSEEEMKNEAFENKLRIIGNVYAGLVDDHAIHPNEADACLKQVGSGTVVEGEGWRFSLKFAGSQLNDFFKLVSFSDFEKWWEEENVLLPQNEHLENMYNLSKQIAESINLFSQRMQNFIYQIHAIKSIESTANDALYSRITSEEFVELFETNSVENINFYGAYSTLLQELRNLRYESQLSGGMLRKKVWPGSMMETGGVSDAIEKILNTQKENNFEQFDEEYLAAFGNDFFEALFHLTASVAETLYPVEDLHVHGGN